MSCEQVLYENRTPTEEYSLISTTPKGSTLRECSQACCDTPDCGVFHYNSESKNCQLRRLPKWLIYIPVPSNQPPVFDISDSQADIVGVLMKRKIRTWIPWMMALVIIVLLAMYISKSAVSKK